MADPPSLATKIGECAKHCGASVAGVERLMSVYYIYVLKSLKNGKRYVGLTAQTVEERLKQHQGGTNRWTKQNGPFELPYTEEFQSRTAAQRREKYLKSGHGRELLKSLFPGSSVGRAADC